MSIGKMFILFFYFSISGVPRPTLSPAVFDDAVRCALVRELLFDLMNCCYFCAMLVAINKCIAVLCSLTARRVLNLLQYVVTDALVNRLF